MKERTLFERICAALVSLVLAGIVAVLVDIAVVLAEGSLQVSGFLAIILVLTLVFYLFPLFHAKRLAILLAVLLCVLGLAGVSSGLIWSHFGSWAEYRKVDTGKEQLFAGHKVMLIVPHQDDDINVLGGAIEEYVNYGSQVYPVFVTNGDFENLAQTRFQETLNVCAHIGIPAENVIFLGYGDTWAKDGPHLYNAEPGAVMESYNGKTQTYSPGAAPVFREGRDYTIENLLEDLEDVILTHQPDVIFCSDYDSHIDHRAVTLAFEKVMGKILKEQEAYRPMVLKGYAYQSAWYAPMDYYEENIAATRNVFEKPCYQYPEVYRWEERVRLPVDAADLSRSLLKSDAYATLAMYASQDANLHAAGVVNGDKVFWYRDTNSLCYGAQVQVSSGTAGLLTDFMLLENHNLVDSGYMPFDGVWMPTQEDGEKRVTVTFSQPETIDNIVLYDHPAEEHNVLDAVILLDDGTQITTGALDAKGAATVIPVERENILSFQILLTAVEGEMAGLTEIEAFAEASQPDMQMIKIVDGEDRFVYDYWLEPAGQAEFTFYTLGEVAAVQESAYTVTCDNKDCQAVLEDGKLLVTCPVGEKTTITVSSLDGAVSDSVYIRNPGKLARWQCAFSQKLEEALFVTYSEGRHWQLATVKLLDFAGKLVGIR